MAAESLEGAADQAWLPAAGRPSLLEEMVSAGTLAATTMAAVTAFGWLGAIVWTGAYLAAYLTTKGSKELEEEDVRDQINAANISQFVVDPIFDMLAGASGVFDTLLLGLGFTAPLFSLLYSAILYTVSHYSPKKLLKDVITLKALLLPYRIIKDEIIPNYIDRMKSFYKRGALFVAANWVLVPRQYQLIGGGIANYFYRLSHSVYGKKEISGQTSLARA
ncbi:MAG: hypothetical protein ABIC95_07475 [archaeon]